MAKDKERKINPVAAHAKSEKNRALKKSKAQVTAQRSEKLARRNPERLQRQIDDLRVQRDAQGGQLRPRDRDQLEQLERDVRAIHKAREQLGDKAPKFAERRERHDQGANGSNRQTLGKRRRGADGASSSEETDEEARNIPMPRDTPPPIPPRRRRQQQQQRQEDKPQTSSEEQKEPKPKAAPQAVYSSAPKLRDLRQEAVSKFVPAAVAARRKEHGAALGVQADLDGLAREEEIEMKLTEEAAVKGGRDIEADLDEVERRYAGEMKGLLVDEARTAASHVAEEAEREATFNIMAEADETTATKEIRRAEQKLHQVELEEAEDDGD